jgi:hypothetical protein
VTDNDEAFPTLDAEDMAILGAVRDAIADVPRESLRHVRGYHAPETTRVRSGIPHE